MPASIQLLTGQVRQNGSTLLTFLGPPNVVIKWTVDEGGGSLLPLTTFTDQWGRATCIYQAGGYVGEVSVQVAYGS